MQAEFHALFLCFNPPDSKSHLLLLLPRLFFIFFLLLLLFRFFALESHTTYYNSQQAIQSTKDTFAKYVHFKRTKDLRWILNCRWSLARRRQDWSSSLRVFNRMYEEYPRSFTLQSEFYENVVSFEDFVFFHYFFHYGKFFQNTSRRVKDRGIFS